MKRLELLKLAAAHHMSPGLAALLGGMPMAGPGLAGLGMGVQGDSLQGAARVGGRTYLESLLGTLLGGAAGGGIGHALMRSPKTAGPAAALSGILGAGLGSMAGGAHGAYAAAQNFNERNRIPPDLLARIRSSLFGQ